MGTFRKPVSTFETCYSTLVICDDGSVFEWWDDTSPKEWIETTPIPGTAAAERQEKTHEEDD